MDFRYHHDAFRALSTYATSATRLSLPGHGRSASAFCGTVSENVASDATAGEDAFFDSARGDRVPSEGWGGHLFREDTRFPLVADAFRHASHTRQCPSLSGIHTPGVAPDFHNAAQRRSITPPYLTDLVSKTAPPSSPHCSDSPLSSYTTDSVEVIEYKTPARSPATSIPPSTPEPAPTLYLTPEYKQLAAPLSEWIAHYLWTVMTAGLNRPPQMPQSLAVSIRGILWSTLLQPAAVFLAFYYLRKLPVSFLGRDEVPGSASQRYRDVVFGDDIPIDRHTPFDSEAPFKVFVNIAMLANKHLDDHCFSCRTWHEISGIAIRDLTTLEFCALDISGHNLWISPAEWDKWLHMIKRYHQSLASCPPLIRSPTQSHTILLHAIQDVVEARPLALGHIHPEPVFIGLAERLAERAREKENMIPVAYDDVDLDADGPLREEYIPRRLTALFPAPPEKPIPARSEQLPMPTKWDPTIRRDGTRPYLAAQSGTSNSFFTDSNASLQHPASQYSTPVTSRRDTSTFSTPLHFSVWASSVRERSASVGKHSYTTSLHQLPSLSAIRAGSLFNSLQNHPPLVRAQWLKA